MIIEYIMVYLMVMIFSLAQLMTVNASSAVQSSTYAVGETDAFIAIDGAKDINDYYHCTHTLLSAENWWQVDLNSTGLVTAVDIYFRKDCCSIFH